MEMRLSRSTLINHLSHRDMPWVQCSTGRTLLNMHDELVIELPFARDLSQLFKNHETFKETLSKKEFGDYLAGMIPAMSLILEGSTRKTIRASAAYLLSRGMFDLRFFVKRLSAPKVEDIKTACLQAKELAFEAASTVSGQDAVALFVLAHRCNINAFAATFQEQISGTRDNDETRDEINKSNLMVSFNYVLNHQHFNGMAGYNHLVAASITHSEATCKVAFEKLIRARPRFETDPDYSLPGMPTISDDPDLKYFRSTEYFRTLVLPKLKGNE